MTVGEPFAPKRRFIGPVVPLALFSEPSISTEAKLLYARLLNYCGDKDHCNPGLPTLARAVAMSEDKAGRALRELQQTKLIDRRRNGPGRTASIRLIWHSMLDGSGPRKPETESLDSAKLRNQADSLIPQNQGVDSAKLRNQADSLIPQNQGVDSAELRSLDSAELRNVYKEEKDQFEKDQRKGSSSSKQHPEVPVQALAPETAQAADDEAHSGKPSATEAEAERGWTPEILAGFCDMLSNQRGQTLDVPFARTWLLTGSLQDALRWWMKCGHKLKPKSPTGFGLYQSDFAKWMAGNQPELSWLEQVALDEFRHKYGLVTVAEQQAEAERQQQQAAGEARRRREANQKQQEHEDRRASYQTMTGEQIRAEIERLTQRLGVVREHREIQSAEYDIRLLKQLPAYSAHLASPAVQKPRLLQELDLARQMLTLCGNRPQSREQIEGRIAELERDLTALDTTDNDGTEADRPAATASPARKQPSIDQPQTTLQPEVPASTVPVRGGEYFRQTHRRQQARERGRPGGNGYSTGAKLAAILGGYGA